MDRAQVVSLRWETTAILERAGKAVWYHRLRQFDGKCFAESTFTWKEVQLETKESIRCCKDNIRHPCSST